MIVIIYDAWQGYENIENIELGLPGQTDHLFNHSVRVVTMVTVQWPVPWTAFDGLGLFSLWLRLRRGQHAWGYESENVPLTLTQTDEEKKPSGPV